MFEHPPDIDVHSSKHNPILAGGTSHINTTEDNMVQNKDIAYIEVLLSLVARTRLMEKQ